MVFLKLIKICYHLQKMKKDFFLICSVHILKLLSTPIKSDPQFSNFERIHLNPLILMYIWRCQSSCLYLLKYCSILTILQWLCMRECTVMFNSVTPWTIAHQAPLSMEFSRQEYWHGLPGDLPDPGIETALPVSPVLEGRFFTTEPSVTVD